MPVKSSPARFARSDDGVDVSYIVWEGEGPPFVNVPGLGSPPLSLRLKMHSSIQYKERLRRGRALVDLDLRGFGISGGFRGEDLIEQWALDIAAVVREVGEPVHLYAWFASSNPAALFARRHPELVLSLTLRSPKLRGMAANPAFIPFFVANYEMGLRYILRYAYDFDSEEAAERFVPEFAAGMTKDTLSRLVSSPLQHSAALADYLPGVTVPVLIVGIEGEDAEAEQAAALLPHARVAMVPPQAINRGLGDSVREAFDRFWLEASGGEATLRCDPGGPESARLSPRELEVLEAIARGKTNARIAAELALSTRTVERHVQNIYTKLAVHSRVEAAAYAIRNGLDRRPA